MDALPVQSPPWARLTAPCAYCPNVATDRAANETTVILTCSRHERQAAEDAFNRSARGYAASQPIRMRWFRWLCSIPGSPFKLADYAAVVVHNATFGGRRLTVAGVLDEIREDVTYRKLTKRPCRDCGQVKPFAAGNLDEGWYQCAGCADLTSGFTVTTRRI